MDIDPVDYNPNYNSNPNPNPTQFNRGRRRDFAEFAQGEEVQMDRVHRDRPIYFQIRDPNEPLPGRWAVPNDTPEEIPPEETPRTWTRATVQVVAVTTCVLMVLALSVCKTVVRKTARAGHYVFVNRQQIRQTCTAVVQSNCNAAKRRIVTFTNNLPGRTEYRRANQPAPTAHAAPTSPSSSPHRSPRRSPHGTTSTRIRAENGQHTLDQNVEPLRMEGIERTGPSTIPEVPSAESGSRLPSLGTGALPISSTSSPGESATVNRDGEEYSDEVHEKVKDKEVKDQEVDNEEDGDDDDDSDDSDEEDSDEDDYDDDDSDEEDSDADDDTSSELLSNRSEDKKSYGEPPAGRFVDTATDNPATQQLQKIMGNSYESTSDGTESFSESTMNESPQASDSSLQSSAGLPSSPLLAATPMRTGAQELSSSTITPQPSTPTKLPKKSVAFYVSPNTGRPITGTKKFIMGESMDFPASSSPIESTLSSIASSLLSGDNSTHQEQATATVHSSKHPDVDSSVDLFQEAKPELEDRDRVQASLLTVDASEEPMSAPGESIPVLEGVEGDASVVGHAHAISQEEASAEATAAGSVSSSRQGRATSRTSQSHRKNSRHGRRSPGLTEPLKDLDIAGRRGSVRITERKRKEKKARDQAAAEAVEKVRKENEAKEAARKAKEAEAAARREKEAEEAARKEREAEEARRKQDVRRIPKEKVIQPLDATWEAKVQQALDTPNMRETLVTLSSGATLTRKDIGTLKVVHGRDPAHGWLNDEIIAACLQHVVDYGLKVSDHKAGETPKYHAFNTFFYKNLRDKGAQSIKKWASKAKIGKEDLLKVERVFIPVHQGAHWTLLVVSPLARTIEYFDSMGGRAGSYVQNAKLWLAEELGKGWKEEEWTVPTGSYGAGPRQTNGSDCGVFTCTTARMVVLGVDPMAYGGGDMEVQRGRMVAELLNGGLAGEFEPRVVF